MLKQILNYWYEQEFFNPCWPIEAKRDVDLAKAEQLLWPRVEKASNTRAYYDVYLGQARSRDLIAWLLNELGLDEEGETIEADRSSTCLCALKLDESGGYVTGSFAISSFVWAIGKLVKANAISANLDILELEKLQAAFDERLSERRESAPEDAAFTKDDLLAVFNETVREVAVTPALMIPTMWGREKLQHANKRGEFPKLDPATELMQSFFLKDLGLIRRQSIPKHDKISDYMLAMLDLRPAKERVQIDTDTARMKQWLAADAFPLGAWPSPYSPSLMQQLGINLAVSAKQNIFSVNGPPGTGKTTLLKEIVAACVVDRAVIMAGYDNPDDAFTPMRFQLPPDEYSVSYYQPDRKLSAYGILVASNNNAAVENISMELPRAIGKARTGRFLNAGNADGTGGYFSDVASALLGEPAWGLVSARLGKRSHLKALKERLWWADDGATLRRYFEEGAVNWNAARVEFDRALQAVKEAREEIAFAQRMLAEQERAEARCRAAHAKLDRAHAALLERQDGLCAAQKLRASLEDGLFMRRENIAALKASLPFLKRLLRRLLRKDPVIKELEANERAAQETVIRLARQRSAVLELEQDVGTALEKRRQAETERNDAQMNLDRINLVAEPHRARFGANWADAAFWRDICANERAQTACPWTYADYDRLREELFYQALMLHKAFLLSSKRVQQNLKRLFLMWDGKFMDPADCNAAYGRLLNTLMLVVPVVSTTFASVQNFLWGVQRDELGLLVIDEAGQATPQSALGALWRTRRAVIVGDPLQVEPIVTIPDALRKRFADENAIPAHYRRTELSVQNLADHCNRYGGVRSVDGDEIWLGCPLVVHRRCLDPMFSISNEIAYNGRMFQKTQEPSGTQRWLLQLGSVWFDVKGAEKGNKNHAVPEQIQKAVELMEDATALCGGLPNIYIITPFTTVAQALQDALYPMLRRKLPQLEAEDLRQWLKENCGTIHTFQGKEADEVLIVLGCDAQSGRGAAGWVGQKPNIINVAVSRAKYRLGVIGDYELWKGVPYVGTVCRRLERQ